MIVLDSEMTKMYTQNMIYSSYCAYLSWIDEETTHHYPDTLMTYNRGVIVALKGLCDSFQIVLDDDYEDKYNLLIKELPPTVVR